MEIDLMGLVTVPFWNLIFLGLVGSAAGWGMGWWMRGLK